MRNTGSSHLASGQTGVLRVQYQVLGSRGRRVTVLEAGSRRERPTIMPTQRSLCRWVCLVPGPEGTGAQRAENFKKVIREHGR